MNMALPAETLRERTRRAVQAELLEQAQTLFAVYGYEAVTIDQIASAAGMSRRSFFRYFGSKEALVLGKYDRLGEDLAAALAARPANEPAWTALRRMFDAVIAYVADPDLAARAEEMDRVIQSSDALRAGFLERMERAQHLVVDVLASREREARPGQPVSEAGLAALVAAAFAALASARTYSQAKSVDFPTAVDDAMAAIAAGTQPPP